MVSIDGYHLRIEDVINVARYDEEVQIASAGVKNIQHSHQVLKNIIKTGKPVYGINTGFGIFADRKIPPQDSAKLSRNLILSHAVGVGEPFPAEVVRAAMLVRANTLAKGFSGIRLNHRANTGRNVEQRSDTDCALTGIPRIIRRFMSPLTFGIGFHY